MTPVILRLNFSLVGKPILSFGNLQAMLDVDAPRYFTTSVSPDAGISLPEGAEGGDSRPWGKPPFCLPSQLPFEKNCGADHVCQDDLGISFGRSG